MGQVDLAELPPHASFSSVSTYLQCQYQYYLERVVQVPEKPALYFVGGSAVHAATEAHDLGTEGTAKQLFDAAFDAKLEERLSATDVPLEEWRIGGRATKANPNKEDRAWWLEKGPGMVQAWIDWRIRSGWEIWSPPCLEGRCIELVLNVSMGGIPVKMVIDRVMITPDGQLVIVDIKTGASEPDNYNQLGYYACGLELAFGLRPQLGGFWMARKGDIAQVHDLEHLTSALVGGWISDWDRSRRAGIFIPHPTRLCRACGVKDYCAAVGGSKAGEV